MHPVMLEVILAVEKLSKDSNKPVDVLLKEIYDEIKMKKFREILLK